METRSLTRVLLSLVAVGALVLGALAFTPVTADALVFCPVTDGGSCIFYSDATYTTAVGSCSNPCCEEPTTSGTITPYRQCQTGYCLAVECPVYQ